MEMFYTSSSPTTIEPHGGWRGHDGGGRPRQWLARPHTGQRGVRAGGADRDGGTPGCKDVTHRATTGALGAMVPHVEALGGACRQVVGEGAAARDDGRLQLHGMMEGRSCMGWGRTQHRWMALSTAGGIVREPRWQHGLAGGEQQHRSN
jgi:hypothetical protein